MFACERSGYLFGLCAKEEDTSMNRSVLALVSILFLAAAASGGLLQAQATNTERELRAAMDQFYEVFLKGEEETIERMTADDYIQTDINGKVQNKTAWLSEYYRPLAARFKAGDQWEVFDRQVEHMRTFGDTFVVLGRMTIKAKDAPASRTLRFTQVWVKRGGAWQRAAAHNAVLCEQEQRLRTTAATTLPLLGSWLHRWPVLTPLCF